LGLKGKQFPLTLQWYDYKKSIEISKRVRLEIAGVHAEVHNDLNGVRTVKNLDLPVQSFSRYHYEHLTNLPILDYTHVKPVLLIVLDNAHLGLPKNILEKETTHSVAGPGQQMSQEPKTETFILYFVETETKWQDVITEFVESVNFGLNNLPPIESVLGIRAKKVLTETTTRLGKHFAIGLPRKENVIMTNSYKMADKRLHGIERKMNANSEFVKKYKTEEAKYLSKDYARELNTSEISDCFNLVWYITHFAVQTVHKPDKMSLTLLPFLCSSDKTK